MGLFAIQIYWIQNAITLRDAQFRRNVKVALAEFNGTLERNEKMRRLQKHDVKRILFQMDSAKDDNSEEELAIESTEQVYDTSFHFTGDETYAVHISKNQKNIVWEYSEEDAERFSRHSEDSKESSLESKTPLDDFQSEQIADILEQLQSLSFGSNFLDLYSETKMDSMVSSSLQEAGGITTAFHFGIFDQHNTALMLPARSETLTEKLVNEGYRMRLLPSDYVTPPTYIHIWFPNQESYMLKTLWPLLTSSGLFLITIVLAFTYTIRTILRQKKISEIKNDFINNMTHEFKTPISTISLACEALADPTMSESKNRVNQFVGMISDENKRLGVLVENVLRSAVLDRGEMELSKDQVDIHNIIDKTIRNIDLQVAKKSGVISKDFNASNPVVKGDKVHLTNVIYNLIDNAIKYSKGKPEIKITTENNPSSFIVKVTDNGIGIKKEDQKRIFDKLFRVHTGNIHDIKGFGLGLSYVKAVIERHHGTVGVTSELGKGSTFTIQIPFDYDI